MSKPLLASVASKIGLLACIGIAAFASPALADVVFTLGNNPQPDEQNINFLTPTVGTTDAGATDTTNTTVFFSTLTGQELFQQAQGQADIFQDVAKPAQNSALTSMDINLTGPNNNPGVGVAGATLGFQDFIMNPLNGSGMATVTAFDNTGQQSFSYALGNGQDYLTLTTKHNEFITDVQLMVAGGSFIEFKQPRISGVCTIGSTCPSSVLPEPSTLALFGGLLLALAGIRGFLRRA